MASSTGGLKHTHAGGVVIQMLPRRYADAMEPVVGLLVFVAELVCVGAVAARRGRRWWVYVLATIPVAVLMAMLVASSGGSGFAAGAVLLLCPAGALGVALASKTGDEVAAWEGSYRGMRKCPHCAESIKAQAKVCKHCGRDVKPAA